MFDPQNGVAAAVRGAFRCAERQGYSPENFYTGRLATMLYDDLDGVGMTFDTPHEVMDYYAGQGGIHEVWKGELAVSLSFWPVRQTEPQYVENNEKQDPADEGAKRQVPPNTRPLREISVIVDDCYLRVDRDQQESIM